MNEQYFITTALIAKVMGETSDSTVYGLIFYNNVQFISIQYLLRLKVQGPHNQNKEDSRKKKKVTKIFLA